MFMALTTGSSTNLAFTLVVISASPTTALAGLSVRWVQPPNAMAAEPINAAVMSDLVFILWLLRVVGDGESRGKRPRLPRGQNRERGAAALSDGHVARGVGSPIPAWDNADTRR